MPLQQRLHSLRAKWAIPQFVLVTVGLPALAILHLTGCAERSTVRAESREIPLTRGSSNYIRPIFSPDGEWVALSEQKGPEEFASYLVPATGGELRQVKAGDAASNVVLGWYRDGNDLLMFNYDAREIYVVTSTGTIKETFPRMEKARFEDVSRDGREVLWCEFTGDNCDLAIQREGGEADFLAVTPEWETDAVFGPDPGEVTLVRRAGFRASTSEIAVWSPETREYTALPIPAAQNSNPAWSPDHRYLAYVSDQGGNPDLWIYEAASARTIQITSTRDEESSPGWSPGGDWLVFSRRARTAHIFVRDPDSGESRQLTRGEPRDGSPSVSPGGRYVAFVRSTPGEGMSTRSLCVVSVEDESVRELDLEGLVPDEGETQLAWSPDGNEIAFSADDGTGNVDIYRVSRIAGRPQRVTILPGNDIVPAWSPDGRNLAYMRFANGETQIYVIPATGGNARQVTWDEHLKQMPAWSPDSRDIAYASSNLETDQVELWVTTADATPEVPERLSLGNDHGNYPAAWTRDGKKVLVWRSEGEVWGVYAVSRDGREDFLVAREEKGENGDFLTFTAEGRAYQDDYYPEGIQAYSHGENASNIHVMRVPELIESKLQADGAWN